MITIVTPTKNRSGFLARQLMYYDRVGFQGCIRIGDSSQGGDLERNRLLVRGLNDKLNISYKEYPELSAAQCTRQLVKSVDTPYAVFVCDDDFLVPTSLEKCRLFLEKNSDYGSAHGVAARIKTRDSMPHGQIITCERKSQPVEEGESASERFLHYIGRLTDALYSVFRIEIMSTMLENIHLVPDRRFDGVLIPNCLSVIIGKIKELDCLSLVRHMQDQPYRSKNELDTFFWVTGEEWHSQFLIFRDILATELMKMDEISFERAKAVVVKGFSIYLAKALRRQCLKQYPDYSDVLSDNPVTGHQRFEAFKSLTRGVPGSRARGLVRSMLGIGRVEYDGMSLPALTNPSSPYHDDFLPIYHAVSNPPERIDRYP